MHKKVLVTGANGFVAHYLIKELQTHGDTVVGVDLEPCPTNGPNSYYSCNLQESKSIQSILSTERPDAIVHLAAVSSVAKSWTAPADCVLNNICIFLNVAEAVRTMHLKTRILSVGSSEEYGAVSNNEIPISESHPLNPCSPYAVARVSQEQLSGLYAKAYGLDIVLTRSFNQIGPGQKTNFVVPSFIQQLKQGKSRGESTINVITGNLSIVRDFIDVRDAVAAYLLLLKHGVSGEVYNICSGSGHTLREILETSARLVGVELKVSVDPSRVRPTDNPIIVGNNSKICQLGWSAAHTLESSLQDIITS